MAVKKKILAPPLSNRYSLVGTAFDYLLRFYLKWLNPNALTHPWIAELMYMEKDRWIIDQARVDYSRYLSSGRISDQLIESTLRLAQLDFFFRSGIVDENSGDVHREDVEDLRALISIVEPQFFKAARLCLLNPTFGEGSHLVGGADADLVIDDAIIDINKSFPIHRFLVQ